MMKRSRLPPVSTRIGTGAQQTGKTTISKIALGGLCALAALTIAAPNASATLVTVTGTYSFSYTPTIGNAPTIKDVLGNPITENLALNSPTAVTNFISVGPAGSCGNCSGSANHNTATGTITATFSFTKPSGATGTLSDTAVYTANYSNDTDSVFWNTSSDPIIVNFTDGAILDVTLGNAQDWTIYPTITFDLVKDPSVVPEPASMALLGVGMIGTAVMARRRRQSIPTPGAF